jgi:hypothetical protein
MNSRIIFVAYLTVVMMLLCGNAVASAPILHDGFTMSDQYSTSNPDYVKGLMLDNLVTLNSINQNGYPIAYLLDSNNQDYYLLRSELYIYDIDLTKKSDLGSWSIARSKDEYIESGYLNRLNNFQRDLDLDWAESATTDSLGCLGAYPLRSGNIDGDGKQELVLFLNDDFLVFSFANHQVVFSAPLKLDDWLDATESQTFIKQLGGAGGAVPQYQSRIAAESLARMQVVLPGQRGYAKLYFGDFNGDGKFDIVVWRKFYVSLMQNDTTKGFKLVSDTYLLYSLENGIYTKQTTDQATIKGWLAAKSLTWQKGYPQTSECTGQTGQPIPEMVDPLLNDPDVLK